MDPLSDLLRVVRLDGAFFYAVEAAEPWIVGMKPPAPGWEIKVHAESGAVFIPG